MVSFSGQSFFNLITKFTFNLNLFNAIVCNIKHNVNLILLVFMACIAISERTRLKRVNNPSKCDKNLGKENELN